MSASSATRALTTHTASSRTQSRPPCTQAETQLLSRPWSFQYCPCTGIRLSASPPPIHQAKAVCGRSKRGAPGDGARIEGGDAALVGSFEVGRQEAGGQQHVQHAGRGRHDRRHRARPTSGGPGPPSPARRPAARPDRSGIRWPRPPRPAPGSAAGRGFGRGATGDARSGRARAPRRAGRSRSRPAGDTALQPARRSIPSCTAPVTTASSPTSAIAVNSARSSTSTGKARTQQEVRGRTHHQHPDRDDHRRHPVAGRPAAEGGDGHEQAEQDEARDGRSGSAAGS